MPQDGLRSMMCRSFVPCNDPTGVVDCRTTIRSNKTSSKEIIRKIEIQKPGSDPLESLASKAEGKDLISIGSKVSFHGLPSSSLQLMEVSRGAEKLKQMIESWSKGLRPDRSFDNMAKDLLRGALDLQEALIMLSKLQEPSKNRVVSHMEPQRRRTRAVGAARIHEFGDETCKTECQKRRFAADGSCRDGTDEIKMVIRESLKRQNLSVDTNESENAYHSPRSSNLGSGISSSSSGQSAMVDHTIGCPTASTSRQENSKGINVIAKLMGLEEHSLKPMQTAHQKKLHGEKTSTQTRPFFDVDVPKPRRTGSVIKKVDPERTLESRFHHSNACSSRESSNDNFMPIVLIKPLRVPSTEVADRVTSVMKEEEDWSSLMMQRKDQMREHLQTRGGSQVRTSSSYKMHRKDDAREISLKRTDQKGGAWSHKEAAWKPENDVSSEEVASVKSRFSHPVKPVPIKEANNKRVTKLQKLSAAEKDLSEEKVLKSKLVSRVRDQASETSRKPRKPGIESYVLKNEVHQPPTSISNDFSNHEPRSLSDCPDWKKNQRKKEDAFEEPKAAKPLRGKLRSKEDDQRTNAKNDRASLVMTRRITPRILPVEEEESEICKNQIRECGNDSQTCLRNFILPSNEPDAATNTADEPCRFITYAKTNEAVNVNLEAFLLRSPVFLCRVEENFDVGMAGGKISTAYYAEELETPCMRLFLDCAVELLECRSLMDSLAHRSLFPQGPGNSRQHISLNKLVQQICDGINALRSHANTAKDCPADSLYAILERDVIRNGTAGGTWDLGWRKGYSIDEAEQVVKDIENLILSGLIKEAFT